MIHLQKTSWKHVWNLDVLEFQFNLWKLIWEITLHVPNFKRYVLHSFQSAVLPQIGMIHECCKVMLQISHDWSTVTMHLSTWQWWANTWLHVNLCMCINKYISICICVCACVVWAYVLESEPVTHDDSSWWIAYISAPLHLLHMTGPCSPWMAWPSPFEGMAGWSLA